MGKAYHLRCENCDWNEVFYLGAGLNDGEAQANEAFLHLLESEHGEEYDAFIRSQEHAGNGIFLFGSTGEGLSVAYEEKFSILSFIVTPPLLYINLYHSFYMLKYNFL